MIAAEHVERQVAVAVVIAVEETALLAPVQGIVGGVQVQGDPLRRPPVGVQEQIDEQGLDGRPVVADPVVAARLARWRMLQAVQGALARQRVGQAARQNPHHRIVAQIVMIHQILVAQRDAEHTLADHRRHRMIDTRLAPRVREAAGEPVHQTDRPVGGAEQQRPRLRGNRAAVKTGNHLAPFDAGKTEQVRGTLCPHRGTPLLSNNSLLQKNYYRSRAPMHLSFARNAG